MTIAERLAIYTVSEAAPVHRDRLEADPAVEDDTEAASLVNASG